MTPFRPMRTTFLPSRLLRATNAVTQPAPVVVAAASPSPQQCSDPHNCLPHCRCFARVQDPDGLNREVWFTAAAPRAHTPFDIRGDHQAPDERTLQLGRTVRTLHERLPTLLKEPLPPEILSPRISLHLFPSTHPHLPTVSGRLAYIAALWTAPVAWGRVPLVGNVKLTITSERMMRHHGGGGGGGAAGPRETHDERLIVRWRTCGKTTHRDGSGGRYRAMGIAARKDPVDKIRDFIAGTKIAADGREAEARQESPPEPEEEFCGIFVFEFDERGRIVKHVIEHTDEGGRWDRMTRVVSVTDWLLGRFHGKSREQEPALALCEERPSAGRVYFINGRRRF